jgi:uncharacterized membrane protein YcaP (DUF421 family)
MDVDWRSLFEVGTPPLELVVRGTVIYWFLFLVFRAFLRRDVSGIGLADVLLIVLVADAAQNAMGGDYRTVTDGIVLVCTIIGWNIVIDWLAFRSARIRALLEPAPVLLVHDGRILHRNLRRELMSVDDLRAKLRQHGIDDVAQVGAARLESDGELSAIRRGDAAADSAGQRGTRGPIGR